MKYQRKDNYPLFPQLAEPYINRCIKNIIHMAGINKNKISFHTARHSFGTLIGNSGTSDHPIPDYLNNIASMTNLVQSIVIKKIPKSKSLFDTAGMT